MTKDGIIRRLMNANVIHEVEGEFFFTDGLDKLLKAQNEEEMIVEPHLRKYDGESDYYPPEINKVQRSQKVEAILTYCEIPQTTYVNGRSYLLHSIDKSCRITIHKILNNGKYRPSLMLEGIKHYYKHSEFKKSFKNFVNDGDIFTMYQLMADGKSLLDVGQQQDPTTWK